MKKRTARVGLLLLSLSIGVVLADQVVKNLLPVGAVVYRLSPTYHQAYIPGAKKFFVHRAVNGGGWVRVEVNRDGYRGRELRSDEKLPRIAVFGDSFIAAEFSPLVETFTERLGSWLEADLGYEVEVVNAGVVGYGPDQVAIRMETELATLRPAMVIVAVTSSNDFGDLVRNKLFRIGPDGRAVRNAPTHDPRLDAAFAPRFPSNSGLAQLVRAAARRLHATFWPGAFSEDGDEWPTADRLLELSRKDFHAYAVAGNNEVGNLFADHWDADVALVPDSPSALFKRALMRVVLREIRDIARANEVPLLLVVVPGVIDIIPAYDELEIDAGRFPAYRREGLTSRVVEIAGELGIPTLDLFEPFRDASTGDDARPLYFRGGDDHWNRAGQDLAARLVAKTLAKREWLP